jgi:hypothetical protein
VGGWRARRRCKHIAALSHPWADIVCTRSPDQDSVRVGISQSRPAKGPCRGAGHGAAGVAQCAKGWHCHLVRIICPPLAWTRDLPANGIPKAILQCCLRSSSCLTVAGVSQCRVCRQQEQGHHCAPCPPVPSAAARTKQKRKKATALAAPAATSNNTLAAPPTPSTAPAMKKGKTTGKKKAAKPVNLCTTPVWVKRTNAQVIASWQSPTGRSGLSAMPQPSMVTLPTSPRPAASGTRKGGLAREFRWTTRTLLTCCGGGRGQQQHEWKATKQVRDSQHKATTNH